MARKATKKEALGHLKRAAEAGLVLRATYDD